MTIPAQLYNDTDRDLHVSLSIDGELFALKYTRWPFRSLHQGAEALNIYSEPTDREEDFTKYSIPFRVQLNPSEENLTRYGLESERDALATFCRYLMEQEYSVIPKVGDRFDYTYDDEAGVSQTEQYELTDVKLTDQWRDSGYFMRYVAAATKVERKVDNTA